MVPYPPTQHLDV
jgi:hypothetical protein